MQNYNKRNNLRELNKQSAKELLDTINLGYYNLGGTNVNIGSIEQPEFYSNKIIEDLVKTPEKPIKLQDLNIDVTNESTVDAVHRECNQNKNSNVGVLNFASAHKPGGGFINGAMAQEEALCQASTLYSQLIKSQMYRHNESCKTGLYNHSMTVTKTKFIRDSNRKYVPMSEAVVITSPAPNMNALYGKVSIEQVESVLYRRMELIVQLFIKKNCKTIILGAYGCGVFGNNPRFVASSWKKLLEKYGGYFDKVVFAVLDRRGSENYETFKSRLK